METASHLRRIEAYCSLIASGLGLESERLAAASRLHDVGMDPLGSGAAPLSDEQRNVLKQHPRRGHALLSGSEVEAFNAAAEIALTHHERFDGQGYPRRLRGEEIPVAGRIVAVADTFDALTTPRQYRVTVTLDAAA